MSDKRKRKVITMVEKLKAIKRLDNGEHLKKVAADYGVGISTVSEWRKNREKLEKWNSVLASPSLKRKVMKDGEYKIIDETLFLWFTQQRQRGVPISGPILQQKALHISEELPVKEAPATFTASDGWLTRWKKRFGVRKLNICGEKLSANEACVVEFITKFKQIIDDKGYCLDQIYNCDETGLNYKMLPSKTLASRNESSASGFKKNKERLTVMACSNASGNHKMPLMVIGKSAKPRAFKHIQKNVMPVYYQNQKSAWMDVKLFKVWFIEQFVPAVKKFLKKKNLPPKAVLVLDNAPSHPNVDELKCGDIQVIFLPPNVTSLLQPMDQGVLENLKRNYRRFFLEYILEELSVRDDKENLMVIIKTVNLRDVIFWLADAWQKVKPSTLQKSWSKLIRCQDNDVDKDEDFQEDDDNIPLIDLVTQIPECETLNSDDVDTWFKNDEIEEELTDAELINLAENKCKDTDENSDDETTNANMEVPKISHSVAMKAFETAIDYVEQQPEATACDVLLLRRWRNIAAKKRDTSGWKQLKITQFVTDITNE